MSTSSEASSRSSRITVRPSVSVRFSAASYRNREFAVSVSVTVNSSIRYFSSKYFRLGNRTGSRSHTAVSVRDGYIVFASSEASSRSFCITVRPSVSVRSSAANSRNRQFTVRVSVTVKDSASNTSFQKFWLSNRTRSRSLTAVSVRNRYAVSTSSEASSRSSRITVRPGVSVRRSTTSYRNCEFAISVSVTINCSVCNLSFQCAGLFDGVSTLDRTVVSIRYRYGVVASGKACLVHRVSNNTRSSSPGVSVWRSATTYRQGDCSGCVTVTANIGWLTFKRQCFRLGNRTGSRSLTAVSISNRYAVSTSSEASSRSSRITVRPSVSVRFSAASYRNREFAVSVSVTVNSSIRYFSSKYFRLGNRTGSRSHTAVSVRDGYIVFASSEASSRSFCITVRPSVSVRSSAANSRNRQFTVRVSVTVKDSASNTSFQKFWLSNRTRSRSLTAVSVRNRYAVSTSSEASSRSSRITVRPGVSVRFSTASYRNCEFAISVSVTINCSVCYFSGKCFRLSNRVSSRKRTSVSRSNRDGVITGSKVYQLSSCFARCPSEAVGLKTASCRQTNRTSRISVTINIRDFRSNDQITSWYKTSIVAKVTFTGFQVYRNHRGTVREVRVYVIISSLVYWREGVSVYISNRNGVVTRLKIGKEVFTI